MTRPPERTEPPLPARSSSTSQDPLTSTQNGRNYSPPETVDKQKGLVMRGDSRLVMMRRSAQNQALCGGWPHPGSVTWLLASLRTLPVTGYGAVPGATWVARLRVPRNVTRCQARPPSSVIAIAGDPLAVVTSTQAWLAWAAASPGPVWRRVAGLAASAGRSRR